MAGPKERRFHESTSRAFSQLAFLALGMLPLFVCVAFCILNAIPVYQSWRLASWESQLTRTLGVTVNIQQIETPTPARTHLLGVRIRDRESHVSIASANAIEVERYRGQWLIQVQEANLEGPRFQAAWRDLHERFLCCPLDTYQEAHVAFARLNVHGAATKFLLKDASIKVARRNDSTRMLCEFHPVPVGGNDFGSTLSTSIVDNATGDEATFRNAAVNSGFNTSGSGTDSKSNSLPIRVVLDRQHMSEEPFTQLLVSAAEARLPAPLAQLMWPSLDALGAEARFSGTLKLDIRDDGWIARIGGVSKDGKPLAGLHVEDVDFEALCWNAPTADVTGTGSFRLQQATITHQQIEYLLGDINVAKGRIRGPFLDRLRTQMGVRLAENLIGGHQDAAFEQASVMFEINSETSALRIVGGLPQGESPHGGVLQDSNALLAARSNAQDALPLRSLVRLLGESPLESASSPKIMTASARSPVGNVNAGSPGGNANAGSLVNQPKLPSRRASFIQRWLPIKPEVDAPTTARTADQDVSVNRAIR